MKKKRDDAPTDAEEKEAREYAFRKEVSEINVLNVKNTDTGEVLFSHAEIIDVSATGLLLLVTRGDIVSLGLRSTLTMSSLHDVNVGFTIEVMDNYIEGIVKRTKPRGGGEFFIAVDFRDDAPEYWRESLVDLLPGKEDEVYFGLDNDDDDDDNIG